MRIIRTSYTITDRAVDKLDRIASKFNLSRQKAFEFVIQEYARVAPQEKAAERVPRQISLRISNETRALLRKLSGAQGLAMSGLVEMAIRTKARECGV